MFVFFEQSLSDLPGKFFQKKGEAGIHVYGETPLSLWAQIAHFAQISQSDFLVDLGCGRGRICLWSYLTIGCQTAGVDWVPIFILRVRWLSRICCLKKLNFICGGISSCSLKKATVVYLYTYHAEENRIDFQQLRPAPA